ncbi:recombinase family protein [Alistipes sp. OttesenSCG-928-B03]|nr:recombinase family protein [Alistipes sp. OttesenSCG-928-B03]
MIKKKKHKNEQEIIKKRKSQDERVAVIWTRVSTAEQYNKNYSIDNQKKACIDYCINNGIRIKKDDYGAKNESAKEEGELFLNMIAEILLDPEVNMVVVYDFDRFTRNSEEGIPTKAKLKRSGIIVTSVNQPIDQSNILADALEDMLIVLAKIDNAMRKHKCGNGMRACLERGEWYSKPPMGFDSIKKDKTHIITVNKTGKLIREAFMWKANENLPNTEIVRRLTARGLTIHKQRLTEIFKNPFYCGKIQHALLGDKIIDGKQEKLVSEEIFNKVQENQSGNHDHYEHAQITVDFPLKRHVFCCEHHTAYTGYMQKGKPYYKCNIKGCKGSNRSAVDMHTKYANMLYWYIVPKELRSILEAVLRRKFKENNEQAFLSRHSLESRLKELKTRETTLRKKYAFDDIDKATFDVALDELTCQQEQLEKELELAQKDISNLDNYISTTISISCKLGDLWEKFDFEICQKIQKMVFPNGVEWEKEISDYRTVNENEVFGLFRRVSVLYDEARTKKEDNLLELSSVVAGAGLEPAAFGL